MKIGLLLSAASLGLFIDMWLNEDFAKQVMGYVNGTLNMIYQNKVMLAFLTVLVFFSIQVAQMNHSLKNMAKVMGTWDASITDENAPQYH